MILRLTTPSRSTDHGPARDPELRPGQRVRITVDAMVTSIGVELVDASYQTYEVLPGETIVEAHVTRVFHIESMEAADRPHLVEPPDVEIEVGDEPVDLADHGFRFAE